MNEAQMKDVETTDIAVLNAIVKFVRTNKYAPNMREILCMTEISSKATIHRSLKRLRHKKYITFVDGESRTIVVLNKKYESRFYHV